MAENWVADVRKYVEGADENVIAAIVGYLGIALRSRDSSLVSFSDKSETDRVRENFLKKKLGLTRDDAILDAAIAGVGERMKEDRAKNRVTVYYLLTEHFGQLAIFGGDAAVAAASDSASDVSNDDGPSSTVPLAAAGLGGALAATKIPEPGSGATSAAPQLAASRPHAAYSGDGDGRKSGMGRLPWLLLAALLAALLFFGLRYCANQETPAVMDEAAISETNAPSETVAAIEAPPRGAGVVAGDREGKPMLTVYFDTGKSDVSNDLSNAASAVKTYLDRNPDAMLAVSGYNDPTGNAAANAELSKNRAKGVQAALERSGIAAEKIGLEKPSETTTTGSDNSAARRVEVTVKN